MASFEKTIGFIGSGNMAQAIIRGMLARELVRKEQVWVSDASTEQVEKTRSALGVNAAEDNRDLVRKADVIIIATKPHHVVGVMEEVRAELDRDRHLLVSICAGVRTATIEQAAGEGVHVVRVMPNTPALIGAGSAAIAPGKFVTEADLDVASQIFDSVGVSVVTVEEKLDAVTGVSGSGPAYVFRFIEGLLEAAEKQGLSRDEALVLVPQMVAGAARMAAENSTEIVRLREAVTTPGGTTAAGLKVLDEGNLVKLLEQCVASATARSRELAGGS